MGALNGPIHPCGFAQSAPLERPMRLYHFGISVRKDETDTLTPLYLRSRVLREGMYQTTKQFHANHIHFFPPPEARQQCLIQISYLSLAAESNLSCLF